MPEVNNAEQLRKWFKGCPALNASNRFRVDFLPENPTEYAIYSSPSTLNYKRNVLGEEVPQRVQSLNFTFASKETYGADVQQNLANLGFYDEVVMWVWEQNRKKNFPEISSGDVVSIVPTLTAFPAEIGSDCAKYQIQLRLTYELW